MLNKLSVVIITKNEESYIVNAVKSSKFADEVLVVDSGSTDKTCSLAKENGANVFYRKWEGYGSQKNYAVSLAKNNWVFVLDADERITENLREEIIDTLVDPKAKLYQVSRKNFFFGKFIRYSGLYPDYSVRLFHRKSGQFNDVQVHESFQSNFKPAKLIFPMEHIAYKTIKEFYLKQKKYACLSSKKKSILKTLISPIWTFIRIYFFRLGFLDGWRGIVIATIYAQYSFWKYRK